MSVAVYLSLFVGCSKSSDDVSFKRQGLRSSVHGISVSLLDGWQLASDLPSVDSPVVVLGKATSGSASIVLSAEPLRGPAASRFSQTLRELEAIGERPELTVERSSIALRTLSQTEVADIQVRYRMEVKGQPQKVQQRTLLIPRPTDPPTMATLTANFPTGAEQAADVERMFRGLTLSSPTDTDEASP